MPMKQTSLESGIKQFGRDIHTDFQHTYTPWRSKDAAFARSVTVEARVDADGWGGKKDIWWKVRNSNKIWLSAGNQNHLYFLHKGFYTIFEIK
jgi:hypothetical protein